MCGRYVLTQKIEVIEKRFNVTLKDDVDYKPSYNIAPGQDALVITGPDTPELKKLRFGMTPFWAKKKMMLVNARAEGDRNKENDPTYRGAKDIINKPAFRKPIRSQRCLVIADCFIEGTEKERFDKPFVVFLRNKIRPFAFAGIWDTWYDTQTGKNILSFAIITTVANQLIQKIPHRRMPVILPHYNEAKWLNTKTPLSDITAMLNPFQSELMNAYPIDKKIKNPRNNYPQLIEPTGEKIMQETDFTVNDKIKKQGMGQYKIRHR